MQRRLAAIVALDVAGYSRLVGADEEGTLARLRAHRRDLLDPLIEDHGGRIANTAGDSLLLEFASAVEATRFALDVQRGMAGRNAEVPPERRIRFRIGLNVGDVIVDGADLLGDGVNVAARLEGLAEPGAICLSRAVRDQVRDRMDLSLVDMGEVAVKNIRRPVRVFHLAVGDGPAPDREPAPVRADTPRQPALAVLPFANMSGDPEQDFFADGMSEDLITDLSRLPGLMVIARNSSFAYRDRGIDRRQVGLELGVHYLLEGSVRRAGDRVRINAQLIDADSGHQLWADRHDGSLDDVFALQDEITGRIVSALSLQLADEEKARLTSRYTRSPEAHDWFLRGRIRYREPGPQANAEAHGLLDRALALDGGFAWALALRGYVRFHAWFFGWNTAADALDLALADAEKAVDLDPSLAAAHAYLGWMHMWGEGHERALAEHETALALDPNFADGHLWYSSTLVYSGAPERAIEPMQRAVRLDPHYPPIYFINFANMYLHLGRHAEAEEALRRMIELVPDFPVSYVFLAAVRAATGDAAGAAQAGAEILKRLPAATARGLGGRFPYARREDADRLVESLKLAGLPD